MHVYEIRNTKNGRCYIGQTTNITSRLVEHKNSLKNNSHHNRLLQDDYNEFGKEAFTFEILRECLTLEKLFYFESHYINRFEAVSKGYNLSYGKGDNEKWSAHHDKNTYFINKKRPVKKSKSNIVRIIKALSENDSSYFQQMLGGNAPPIDSEVLKRIGKTWKQIGMREAKRHE